MEEPLLPKLPELTREDVIARTIKEARNPSVKSHDFFILYCTKGIDGQPLPDAEFAKQLKSTLEEEKLMSGRKVRVAWANGTDINNEIVLTRMSQSLVVLVVFSEAALQTFAGDAHEFKQSNYLLFLQFALMLHDACAVRVLGLNMVAVDDSEEHLEFIKFQGWCVRFNDVPHYSEWIQDSISKSMKRIFAIQGINIDLDEWEYKIPTLFATLYAMQDDINSTRWASTLKIMPWRNVWGLLLTFMFCFLSPVPGFAFCIVKIYTRCTQKSHKNKQSYTNVALFGTGMQLVFIAAGTLAVTVISSVQGALCSSDFKCEVLVESGARWARWKEYAESCDCYDDATNPYHNWLSDWPVTCAVCVCKMLRDADPLLYDPDQKNCDTSTGVIWGVITAILFVLGFVILGLSLQRLQKQALVSKQKLTIGVKGDIELKEKTSVDLSV